MKTFEPPQKSSAVRLPADIENLPRWMTPVLEMARATGLGEDGLSGLELALEECLVNVCRYAYPDGTGWVEISCRVEPDRLVVLVEDEGIAFSIAEAAEPDLTSEISERKIGGLGIHIIRSLMDEVVCWREGNRNLLELVLHLPAGGGDR